MRRACRRHAETHPIQPAEPPLIVTAALDDASFKILDGLRLRHFPAHLNVVPAHVSLFHNLPGGEVASVSATLTSACRVWEPFDLEPCAPMFLGRGVAYRYESADLSQIRALLARAWDAWLVPQDRQGFRAHVTLQNKVEPKTARALFETMTIDDVPVCRVVGLALWRYRGGPWEPVEVFPFEGLSPDQYGEITA